MILDSISKFSDYEKLHPLFSKAFDFLKSLDIKNPELGKFELDGKNLFVIISNSELKPSSKVKLEAHNEYIDIQLPLSKSERFGWRIREELKIESDPFDTTKDIIFYEDEPSTYIDVKPGNFVIFFPQDAHAPCIGDNSVIKIVVKIKVKPE